MNDPTINPKDNTLYIAKGSSRSLNVYGDFSEGNSNYIVNLSKFVYVEKVYSSEDNTVAYVDKSGKVTAKAIGETTIKVEIEGKQSNLKIRVVDPTTINVKDIKLSLEKDKTVVGYKNTIIPMVSDYDENSFYIESKFLDVKALDDKISIGKDNEILALKSGKAKIEVSYKDITKYLDIDVNEKPKNIVVNSGELIDKDRLRDAIDFENSIEIIGSLWTLEINDKKTIEELYKLTKDKLQMTLEEDKSKLEKNQISSLNVITNIGELPEGSYNLKVSVPKELDNSMLKIETLDDKKLLGEGLVTNSRISFEVKSLKGKLVLSTKEQKKPEGNGENNNGSSNNTGNSNSNNNVIQNEKKEENTNTLPRTGAVLNSVNIFIFAILLILIGAVLRRYRKV